MQHLGQHMRFPSLLLSGYDYFIPSLKDNNKERKERIHFDLEFATKHKSIHSHMTTVGGQQGM